MTATIPPQPATDDDRSDGGRGNDVGLVVIVIVAFLALVLSFVAFATSDGDLGASSTSAEGGDASDVPTRAAVSLAEFAISPESVVVSGSGVIDVSNDGSQVHNLAVRDTDVATPDLNSGEAAQLDVSSLAPGEYELWCDIAGHAEAGMVGTVVVGDTPGEAAAGGGGDDGSHAEMTEEEAAALDQAMIDSMMAFPAETEGVGNQVFEPEILADGTKRFELTAEIVEWEVEPGKFVEAWTYNGMVPGPYMKVEVGDELQFHIQNDLPLGTDVHWHGISTPNEMDGVAPYTQDVIAPGEDFTYEFTAEKKAVGIYHAHIHGQMAVPNGMLGILQIGDVDLPRGRTISGVEIPADLEIAQEIPMVLNDAGTIGLSLNGKSFPATEPIVADSGDWIMVHYANEGLQVHPMHQHQFPQLVVAKDGIPLDNPYFVDTLNVAPGERYTVIFNPNREGTWVFHCHILTHVEREEGMFGMVTAVVVQ